MYKLHLKRVAIFAILGLILGVVLAIVMPKVYEARAEVLLSSPGQHISAGPYFDEVNAILDEGNRHSPHSEQAALLSPGLFVAAVQQVAERTNHPELLDEEAEKKLLNMYDVVTPPQMLDDPYDPIRYVTIRVRAFDPQVAADIANEVYKQYDDNARKQDTATSNRAIAYLQAQDDQAKKALALAAKNLQNAEDAAKIPDLGAVTTGEVQYRLATMRERDDTLSRLYATNAEIAKLRSQISSVPQFTRDSQERPDPAGDQMALMITRIEDDRNTALQSFTEDAPQVRELTKSLARARARLAQYKKSLSAQQLGATHVSPLALEQQQKLDDDVALKANLESALGQLNQQLTEINARYRTMPAAANKISSLTIARDIAAKHLSDVEGQFDTIQSRGGAAPAAAVLASPAVPDPIPAAPDMRRYAILCFIAGTVLGLLYSFSLESMRLPVYTSGQLAELTGLPVAATVPALKAGLSRDRRRALPKRSFRPLEAYRYLVVSSLASSKSKVVLFTGVGTSTGASSCAAEFAIAAAESGASTLLVDASVAHPQLSQFAGNSSRPGLSDMLAKHLLGEITDSLETTEHENLTFLSAGSLSDRTLASYPVRDVQGIFNSLRSVAELIVIYSAPCNVLSDASFLAPVSDETYLVVSAKATGFREIPMAQDLLMRAGAKNMALVLTNASPTEEPFGVSGVGHYAEAS